MSNVVSPSQNSSTITLIEVPDSDPQTLDDDVQIITSQDKCVNLDDDSDVIIEEDTPNIIDVDSDDLEIIESKNTPIVIEDEDRDCVINPLNVVKQKRDQLFDMVCRENSSLAQVIEDAINLDSSGCMKRIIQRSLIPLYLTCSISFKKSEFFKNSLVKTTILLERAPHLKYSHIKSLCETLKLSSIKRAGLLKKQKPVCPSETRTGQPKETSPKKKKYNYKPFGKRKKRRKEKRNGDQSIPKTNKDNTGRAYSQQNQTSEDTFIEIEVPVITSTSPSSNKENIIIENRQDTDNRLPTNSNNTASTDNTEIDSNSLLKPHYSITTQATPLDTTKPTVEWLEKEIAVLKKDLEKIEEQEVVDDNIFSPYLVAETLKSKIVKLYKQLCELTGSEPIKRHEVKLQVVNGHPPGPARCLQEYINDNIDEFGNPPFPDIFEVVRCVETAVEQDRLNWNRKQIVAEAQVLLKHYGHAIQKRRKKREWRDMVSRCKEELVDPADLDPALEAKLLENSRIAKRNENEIVDRYARLEKENSSNPEFRISLENARDSESDSDEEITYGANVNNIAEENSIQNEPSSTIPDSTTNLENIQVCTNNINSINIQGNLNNINSESIKQSAANTRNVLEINPQLHSNIVSVLKSINTENVAESNVVSVSSHTNFTTNQQNNPIIIVNSPNNMLPNLHGRICYINSMPMLATMIPNCTSFINPTKNVENNLQNAQNNLVGSLRNGPNFINSNNLANKLQNGPNFINSNNLAVNNRPNFINSNNLTCNLENEPNFMNSTNLAGNLENGLNFINSNNLTCNLENEPNFMNSTNLIGNLQNGPNFIKPLNSLEENEQNRPKITSTSNNLQGNLQNDSSNKEDNHSCPFDSTTKETQSTITNVGNEEYNRTIAIDSNGSDTDNERRNHTDLITNGNTVKERDKSDEEEIEYKIKVKQEEDDVMQLLSELGSDCVATVFDIEDPFLAIEVSDSSEEED